MPKNPLTTDSSTSLDFYLMGIFSHFKKNPAKNPAERYLDHLIGIFEQEPALFLDKSLIEGVSGVSAIVFQDIPEPGYMTAFTYGLSLVKHPDWKLGRPELCISVASTDVKWATAMAAVANKLRGDCPFSYGNSINFREQISDESQMDAFFVMAPSTIDKELYSNIDIGLPYKISIAGLYPIYAPEMNLLDRIGLKDFWHHPGYDNYSVTRPPIVE